MRLPLGDLDEDRESAVAQYLLLTREVLPKMAKTDGTDWPVVNDHCFQRIVLDTICGGVWYDFIPRPAYKTMTCEQAKEAVALCERIISGKADLSALNSQSLAFRGKLKQA